MKGREGQFPFIFECIGVFFSTLVMNVKAIKMEKLRSWGLREGATSHKDSKHRNVLSVKLLEAKNRVEVKKTPTFFL